MKTILVTGCAGNTGSFLCELLLKDENNLVIGIDNFFRGTRENLNTFIDHERFQFLEADLTTIREVTSSKRKNDLGFLVKRNPDNGDLFWKLKPALYYSIIQTAKQDTDMLEVAIKDLDEIYNLAAVVPTRYFYERPDLTYKVNCEAAIKLFDIARKVGVKKFLNASSSEIYGHNGVEAKETNQQIYDSVDDSTRWSYAHGKILTEYYMNHFKNDIYVVHLRYANCAGRRDLDNNHILPYIINSLLAKETLILNSKPDEFTRSYLSMEDAATATYVAMEKGISGTAYNVGTHEEVTIRELYGRCLKILYEVTGDDSYYDVDVKFTLSRPGDPKRRVLNCERILRDTGWKPEYNLDYIIKSVIEENLKANKE